MRTARVRSETLVAARATTTRAPRRGLLLREAEGDPLHLIASPYGDLRSPDLSRAASGGGRCRPRRGSLDSSRCFARRKSLSEYGGAYDSSCSLRLPVRGMGIRAHLRNPQSSRADKARGLIATSGASGRATRHERDSWGTLAERRIHGDLEGASSSALRVRARNGSRSRAPRMSRRMPRSPEGPCAAHDLNGRDPETFTKRVEKGPYHPTWRSRRPERLRSFPARLLRSLRFQSITPGTF